MSNKKTFRKYAVSTMAAATAAAAVVPAAVSADSVKSFPDVKEGDAHYDAIMALTEAGVIKGFEDGTFGKWENVTRAQVAAMLTKQLELEVPGDLEAALKDYKDITPEHRYAEEIAAVTAAGVFKGNTNDNFNAYDPISRQQMATVLVKGLDLNQYVEGDDVNVNLDKVSADHKDSVQTLANLGITNQLGDEGDNNFEGYNDISRAAFATFLYKANNVTQEEEEDVAPEVANVEALNAKQIKVEFNQAVGTNAAGQEALDNNSYSVKELNGEANNVEAVSRLDEKTVVLTLDKPYRVATDVSVTAEDIYIAGSIKETVPKFSTVITVHDTEDPEIVSVNPASTNTDSTQSVTVYLSEPIKGGDEAPTFRINNETVEATPTTGDVETATAYKISDQDLAVGENHTLEILNATDYADHKVQLLTKDFTVEKDTEIAQGDVEGVQDNKVLVKFDKPVKKASVEKYVNLFTYDETSGAFSTAYDKDVNMYDGEGKEWILTINDAKSFYNENKNTEEVLVKVDKGVVDTSGNLVQTFESKVHFTQDTTGPELQEVTMDKNSKGEVEKLYFEYDELLTTANPNLSNLTLLNKDNNKDVDFTKLFEGATAKVDTDGKTVTVTVDPTVASGNYEVTSEKGFVQDDAATPNDSQKVTKDLYIGEAEKIVEATVTDGENKFTVTFDKAVTSETAMNPANYTVDGKALPADTKIVVENDQTVKFELPEGFIADDKSDAKVTIDNIVPVDSNAKFSPYAEATHTVLDNTAPEVNGKILGNGEIFLTFSEDVKNVSKEDFDKLIIDGKTLKDTAYTVATEEKTDEKDAAVRITVNADVATDSGYSYLFINVDGKKGYNADLDIKLDQVEGDAPDAWYEDSENEEGLKELKPADLNVVDTVLVHVKEDASTKDTSELENSLKEGNVKVK